MTQQLRVDRLRCHRFVTRTGEILAGHDQLRAPLGAMIQSKTKLQSRVIKIVTVGDPNGRE
jgi:hypothetical protein